MFANVREKVVSEASVSACEEICLGSTSNLQGG